MTQFFNHQPQGDHVMDRYAFYACTYLDKENELPSNRQYRYCYQKLEGTQYEFAGYFSDKRYMASDRRRFGLLKMMKAAEEGQFNKILMNDINRMALNHDNLIEIVRRFKHVGVEVYTNLGKAAPLSWQLAEEIRLAEEEEVYLAAQEWEAQQDNLFEDYVSHQESAQQSEFGQAAIGDRAATINNTSQPQQTQLQEQAEAEDELFTSRQMGSDEFSEIIEAAEELGFDLTHRPPAQPDATPQGPRL